jgi:hypothetical protein
MSPQASAQVASNSSQRIIVGRDGRTAYSIYIDAKAPASVRTAAGDLRSYFRQVAGFEPPLVSSAQPPAGPYISLGSTGAAKAAGLDASTIPPYDGYRIVTRGANIFILGTDTADGQLNNTGGTYSGTSNGVATFIEDYLGVRWLGGNIGDEFTKLNTVEIPVLNRTESSPFPYRALQSRSGGTDWQRRMKLARNVRLAHSHNYTYTIPPSLYDQHPTWFAEIGGVRPRPSGDRYKLDTLNPELVQAYADRVIAAFRKDPNLYSHSLSANDGGNWSDSEATKAWTELDPNGEISRTPLMLKFYNDVAKIVGREFPDRKLGGYIYESHLFPPRNGIPKLEPNLALVLATSNSYGYQLLRPNTQREWDKLMREWSEAAHKQGVDVYYYDLPLALHGANNIQPTSPEMLNFIFSRVAKYGYKGGPVAGSTDIGNYLIARLLWNPRQDAVALAREYYRLAYGTEAAPHMEKMYDVLNEAFTTFYIAHPTASYTMKGTHLREIYGNVYPEVEKLYLQARNAAKEEKHRTRMQPLARSFSLLQWNLKANGALPVNYQSEFTITDEQIDQMQGGGRRRGAGASASVSNDLVIQGKWNVRPDRINGGTGTEVRPQANSRVLMVPRYGPTQLLLHVSQPGEVSVTAVEYDADSALVPFTVSDEAGATLRSGIMRAGRVISFAGEAGKNYLFTTSGTTSELRLEVRGAAAAMKADSSSRGMGLTMRHIDEKGVPLYFYVPAGAKSFQIKVHHQLREPNMKAEVIAPDGRSVGQVNADNPLQVIVTVPQGAVREGFWRVVVSKPMATAERVGFIVLDPQLPQWFLPDNSALLAINPIK